MTRLLLWQPTLQAGGPAAVSLRAALAAGVPGASVATMQAASASARAVAPLSALTRELLAGRPGAAGLSRALRDSDAVVLAGEPVLASLTPGGLSALAPAVCLTLAAAALRKPLVLLGVSAGPLANRRDRALARRLATQADLLVLRDEESAHVLEAAGLPSPFRVGADPVWLLFDAPAVDGAPTPRDGSEHVIVALDGSADARAVASIAEGLRPLAPAGLELRVQPWRSAGDRPAVDACLDLARRLGRSIEVLPPPADVRAASRCYGEAAAIVGVPFHSLVAAAAAGTPFVGVPSAPGVAGLCRRMGQAAVPPDRAGSRLAPAVMHALDGPQPPPAAVAAERRAAHEELRLLRVLLAGGRTEESDQVAGLTLAPEGWVR